MSERRKKLYLLIYDAKNLLKKDIFGLSDPYVKVQVKGTSFSKQENTFTVKKTLQPKWDQVLVFSLKVDQFSVIFDVYDENILSRDDFLGRTILHFDLTSTEADQVTNELYMTSSELKQHGIKKEMVLMNKWRFSLLDGFHRLPHVREMEAEFHRKSFLKTREEHNSWGNLTVYYSIHEDHNVHSSIISTPESVAADSQQDSDSENEVELPSGWERRLDSNGRALFLNHVHRQVSLRRPFQQIQHTPAATAMSPAGETRGQMLHHRAFIERRNSIDVIDVHRAPEEEEVGFDGPPPHAEEPSVLRPLAFNEIEMSISSGQEARVSGTELHVRDVSQAATASAHPPQLQTALERASQGLAPRWEASMTPSGRIYYINHDTQTTTWEKPRYFEEKPVQGAGAGPVDQDPELPPGWEARKNKDGRTYYVDHKRKITTWKHPKLDLENEDDLGPLPAGWEVKQMEDGRIFFVDHHTHSTQWEDPRLLAENKPTAKMRYSRDYKQKYTNFRSKLGPKHQIPRQFDIPCRRDNVFEDTYNVIMNVRDVEVLKARLYVIFQGEKGLDYGGVAREWFHLLSHEMFNPYYGLFEYSASDDYTLQINPDSAVYNEHHLDYFKFIGRICAMAVYHNRLLDAFFIRPFYKMMLKKSITLDDMQSVDVELWNSFSYILENDPEPLCLDFSVNKTIFDDVIQVDLKPGGRNIPVTESNKREYIDLLMKWRFTDRVLKQMNAFLDGFSDLVPLDLIKVFDERELEYMLGGLAEIDVEDWKRNTEYNDYNPTENVIQWFWKAVENFDGEMRARLLQFVTGTSKVPMNGFSELQGSQGPRKFCIKKYGLASSLPRAHTCFNRIDLPPYPSYHKLKENLRLAVENTEGFEGVD